MREHVVDLLWAFSWVVLVVAVRLLWPAWASGPSRKRTAITCLAVGAMSGLTYGLSESIATGKVSEGLGGWAVWVLWLGLGLWVLDRGVRAGAGRALRRRLILLLAYGAVALAAAAALAVGSSTWIVSNLARVDGPPAAGDDLRVDDTAEFSAMVVDTLQGRVIVVSAGILSRFGEDEARFVVEHERAHARHRDDVVSSAIAGSLVAVALAAGLTVAYLRRHGDGAHSEAVLTARALSYAFLVGFLLHPIANEFGRVAEFRADRAALDRIADKRAAITALARMTGSDEPTVFGRFFRNDHPTLRERISNLEDGS